MQTHKGKKDGLLSTRQIVIIGILGAITVVLGLTPLGFVPIGPLNATTMHIPVLVAAFLEGPVVGGFVGLIFGLSSLFNAITRPTPISIVFYNPLISILPRVLLGIVSYYLYAGFRKIDGNALKKVGILCWIGALAFLLRGLWGNISAGEYGASFFLNTFFLLLSAGLFYGMWKSESKSAAVVLAAFVSTIFHSAMVMSGIYIFFAEEFVKGVGASMEVVNTVIFGTIITSGVPEGILAAIITTGVVTARLASIKKK
ncbi:putative membrane protein [Peptoniphilus ivorii]|uniref:ECF transporter S component n=1 Tax=Aedoeadaptatus ivorii TaxID=54006 RepID=UPI00277FD10B|nr:ECF transporter S component [Peptoniphilus ivorii]MDQ0508737.1 putative membrane protein [Peptoniphilus ivorii]